ncbi:uncharacterized protein LOC128241627 [Mya arenaria]|uniref:uncharacterized protein LOC128241627 n=1 Tax=Mya arenaria TaxID=6604 RepID=UPI0022E8F083|nr:uncharacterized protein LOC128241627 [Mya arenaria]
MPAVDCPIKGCDYQTPDLEPTIAAALITAHNATHISRNTAPMVEKADAVPDDYPMGSDPANHPSVSSYKKHLEHTATLPTDDDLFGDKPKAHVVHFETKPLQEPKISTVQNQDPVTAENLTQNEVDAYADDNSRCNKFSSCWKKFAFLFAIGGIVVPFAGLVVTIVYIAFVW